MAYVPAKHIPIPHTHTPTYTLRTWLHLCRVQVGAIISESFRLCLIQILLQSRGIKLNPITTLYYVAPACAACLCLPFAALEMTKLLHATDWDLPAGLLLLSAISAFGEGRRGGRAGRQRAQATLWPAL